MGETVHAPGPLTQRIVVKLFSRKRLPYTLSALSFVFGVWFLYAFELRSPVYSVNSDPAISKNTLGREGIHHGQLNIHYVARAGDNVLFRGGRPVDDEELFALGDLKAGIEAAMLQEGKFRSTQLDNVRFNIVSLLSLSTERVNYTNALSEEPGSSAKLASVVHGGTQRECDLRRLARTKADIPAGVQEACFNHARLLERLRNSKGDERNFAQRFAANDALECRLPQGWVRYVYDASQGAQSKSYKIYFCNAHTGVILQGGRRREQKSLEVARANTLATGRSRLCTDPTLSRHRKDDHCFDIEFQYFHVNANVGRLLHMPLHGEHINATHVFAADPNLGHYMAANLPMWMTDSLPARIEALREMLQVKADVPQVIYVHCEQGVDRTGELVGAFWLRAGMSYAEVLRRNYIIAGNKRIHDTNARALYWYCLFLAEKGWVENCNET